MANLKLKFPANFFDEEIRCGYKVTNEMKKVWAVELDMLAEFDRVCKKHNITYFASGGTMLGAVRHHGFIPWDDDIDLMMFRDQYIKLCVVASDEFKHPYFFQTEYTDQGTLRGHAQLRNSETTAILTSEAPLKRKFNQGIFLDIFPLDNVINNTLLFKLQEIRACIYKTMFRKLSVCSINYNTRSRTIFGKIVKHLIRISVPQKLMIKCMTYCYMKFEETCQMYNDRNTDRISTLSFMFEERSHIKYRSDYSCLIEMPFEFLTIPIGANYEHALDVRYGNWHELVQGTSIHGGIILDTEKPYTEYIK